MENPTYIALSRLVAQQRTLDVIANNIANSSTPGFKTEHVLFSDWLAPEPSKSLQGEHELSFTQDRATWRDQAAGTLTHTGNPLDLAIRGNGYFTVLTDAGPRLTRAGRFSLQPDGTIGDDGGNPLLDATGSPLRLNSGETNISVAGDGTITSDSGRIGKIGVVIPEDLNRLSAQGGQLFQTAAATSPVVAPKLIQGAVEDSNVSPMIELTRMMQLERDFQLVTQFVQSEADRQTSTIDKMSQSPTD